ncbi:hypothetical protein HK098_004864 [Nowakowskiella sp. JEL0407]|nr:hypothetical protein HK098_004864 [Nowakowskiella sp. JEL0407]
MAFRKSSWSEYGLKTQLLIVGISTTLVSLIIVEAISLGFLGGIISNISSTARDVLTTQIKEILTASVEDSAALFENDLEKSGKSITLLLRRAAGDTFRSDQPLAPVASFFDSPDGIKAAGILNSTDPRYPSGNITLEHSTYVAPNYLGLTPPQLDASQQRCLDATAHLDVFFRNVFKLNPALVASYCGFDNGLHRTYPGTGFSRQVAYDPRGRDWYKDAFSNPTSNYVVSDPYQDKFGRGWVYSISAIITNTTSTQPVGVAGVDVLISTLKSQLEEISKGFNGTNSLYLDNGITFSTPSWDLTKWTSTSPARYENSTNPVISKDLWDKMLLTKSQPGKAEVNLNYEDPQTKDRYLLVYMTLNVTNGRGGRYIALSTFPLANINRPVQTVEDKMTRLLGTFSGISLAIFFAVLAIVMFSITSLASAFAAPLVRLSEESKKISNNIGSDDLTADVRVGSLPRGRIRVKETDELTSRFYEMIKSLRESSSSSDVQTGNAFFNNADLQGLNLEDFEPPISGSPPNYSASSAASSSSPVASGSNTPP